MRLCEQTAEVIQTQTHQETEKAGNHQHPATVGFDPTATETEKDRKAGFLGRPHSWVSSHQRMTCLLARPHLDIGQWLNDLDLLEYKCCFQDSFGVEDLLYLDEADIKALGVKNGAHRAKIVSSLVILRNKYEKSTVPRIKRTGLSNSSNSKCAPVTKDTAFQSLQLPGSLFICVPNNRISNSANKCGMEPVSDPNASPQQLRKALEWELSLDNRDLRSHAWYHGSIPRARAEELVNHDGDFLIRDCISQPGDFVLTCRSKGLALHFVINKMVLQPNTVYERIQYQLEDDSYDTVPNLVTCYVGSGKPISLASAAKIVRPINRSMPLSFYAVHYGHHCGSESDVGSSRNVSPLPSLSSADSSRPSPFHSPQGTPHCSPPVQRRQIPGYPTLPDKQRGSSMSPMRADGSVDATLLDDSTIRRQPLPPLPPPPPPQQQQQQQPLIRAGSEPMLSPRLDRRNPAAAAAKWVAQTNHVTEPEVTDGEFPPPKPSRTPSKRYSRRPYVVMAPVIHDLAVVQADGVVTATSNESDSGNGSGDSIHSADILLTANMTLGSVKKRPVGGHDRRRRPASDTRFSFLDHKSTDGGSSEGDSALDEEPTMTLPTPDPPSTYDLGPTSTIAESMTLLLPATENKPLDGGALQKVRSVLMECGPRILAAHLTRIDLEILKTNGDIDLGLGITTGFELLTLPQGQRLRLDLIERTDCLKLFVAVTILTCLNEVERGLMLRKWIEIAVDTKTALGNLYSFTGIMLGLGMPQIQRLKSTWNSLRLSCTDIALTYETKLRPTLKCMNECNNPQAPNTTIPHLLPLVIAIEKSMEDLEEEDATVAIMKCTFPWEQSSSDYGTNLLFSHLETGRSYVKNWNMYKRNGEIALEDVKYEELLLAMFRTEFHLKFLWGSKGAWVRAVERHTKFEQILTVMSERCESS